MPPPDLTPAPPSPHHGAAPRRTPLTRRTLLLAALAGCAPASQAGAPALTLARIYRDGLPLGDYRVSEKFDGVRAYWDGQALYTRGGHRIQAPAWFTEGWPRHPLDGELWAGRGQYTAAASAAAREVPDDSAWRALRYMVFDRPDHPGDFDQRHASLLALPPQALPTLVVAEQQTVADAAELRARLRAVVQAGGEGLMLRRAAAPYRGGRSDDLLKLKEHLDAEATVVGHLPGQGRHSGRLGALLLRTPEGLTFRLGSGLSDDERRTPPPLGSTVTYRYRGLHPNGTPRFAHFVRQRLD